MHPDDFHTREVKTELDPSAPGLSPWQKRVHEIIFEADTPAGKAFDVSLLIAILLSVTATALESVASISATWGPTLLAIEWLFTILFTVEYILRLLCLGRPWRYAFSFFGIVDLLSILPTYFSLIFAGSQSLSIIRIIRLLRIFRVLKLAQFIGEQRMLHAAIRASTRKIVVFLGTVLTLVLVLGATMYLIEGPEHGFTNIPQSIYWAIVTLTTVGYGDIAPQTVMGKILASLVMIVGYAIIAVPTGIVTVELAKVDRSEVSTKCCSQCALEAHAADANYCRRCGTRL